MLTLVTTQQYCARAQWRTIVARKNVSIDKIVSTNARLLWDGQITGDYGVIVGRFYTLTKGRL
jgi:hypothetical protein